eukprot:4051240-Pyramimonas_sp.AAC.1
MALPPARPRSAVLLLTATASVTAAGHSASATSAPTRIPSPPRNKSSCTWPNLGTPSPPMPVRPTAL